MNLNPPTEPQLESPCRYCRSLMAIQGSATFPYCCKACEQLDQIDELHSETLSQRIPQVSDSLLFLEDPDHLKNFSQNESLTEFVFRLDGLECASCVHLIEKLPLFYSNLKEASVDYSQSLFFVELNSPQGLGSLVQMLRDWGYTATPLRKDELLLPQLRQENRKQLLRLAITGGLTGNVMLFTIPIYAGVDGPLKTLFLWLHFIIFLPVLFYSALPFYRGAWNSLKVSSLSVDLPITLALWAGFSLSTLNLFRGSDEVYFDSTASFVFLILVTRYFVHRIQQTANNQRDLSTFIPPQSYRILESEPTSGKNSEAPNSAVDWKEISTEKILPGQWIELQRDQIFPADGILNSPVAEIDTSLFSGESLPQIYHVGMTVHAGTKLISGRATFQVTKTQTNTALGGILTDLAKEALKKNHFVQITDKLSQALIAIVLFAAIGYLALNSEDNFQEAFHRALALIIVACPCAMAFGTPLAYALGLKKARARGLLVKNASVFEKMRGIKSIFLDKTGTVTRGHLHLVKTYPLEIPAEIRSIILGLEVSSQHPLAFAFRRAWFDSLAASDFIDIQELPGLGVEGRSSSGHWILEKSNGPESSGLISVALKQNGRTMAYFYFADEIQPHSKEVIKILSRGFEVNLLSGDRGAIVSEMALDCGLPDSQVFAEASPYDKEAIVRAHPGAMMVGDGINDILAFQAADISVAVRSSQLQNQNWADVICLREGLDPLLDLVSISKATYKTLIGNLSFAILYNALAGFFALGGYINPLVAAILMPVSSVCILLITLRGLK